MSLSQFEEAFKGTQAYTNLWLGKATSKDAIFERLDENQYVIDEVESARIMWEFCANKSQNHSREVEQLVDERDCATEKAEALKDKLQVLYGVDFGEHSNGNCPFQNAIEYDDSSFITYMQEREAFYQNWKDSRNSISVDLNSVTVGLTGDEKQAYLKSLTDQLAETLKNCTKEQQIQAFCGAPPLILENDCMIDQTWFMKGSPVAALIKHAEDNYKATAVAQNSKIKFGTDDNEHWFAHDVPFFGRVQIDRIEEHGLVEWDIFFNECWQGPFNTKERAIQHLEECIAEKHEEMSNCANE